MTQTTTFSSSKCGVDAPLNEPMPDPRKVRLENGENVLFLDFDGVCNSYEHGSYVTHDPDDYDVDPDIMYRIREICIRCNAKVVVSSNWRKFPPDGSYRFNNRRYFNPLKKLYKNIGDLIVGTLTSKPQTSKLDALEMWFDVHPDFDGRYAIVDDDQWECIQDHWEFRKNLWLTDREFGLTEQDKEEIIKHLGGH